MKLIMIVWEIPAMAIFSVRLRSFALLCALLIVLLNHAVAQNVKVSASATVRTGTSLQVTATITGTNYLDRQRRNVG